MSFLDKLKAKFKDDWCEKCTQPMVLRRQQLYMLPSMTVGHYVSHDDPNYYYQNLVKVTNKSEIPAGFYACTVYLYHCPHCQHDLAKLVVFLPVRDEEQIEEAFLYDDADLLRFLQNS